MRKQVDCTTIGSNTRNDLTRDAQAMLQGGWEVSGGVAVSGNSSAGNERFYLTLVKYEDPDW